MGTKQKAKKEKIEERACKLADKLTSKFSTKDALAVAVLLGRVLAGSEKRFDRAVDDSKAEWLPEEIREMQPEQGSDRDDDDPPLRAVEGGKN